MKVSDMLRVKGSALYTIKPDDLLLDAAALMAEKDIGSLIVMSEGELAGLLTFREIIRTLTERDGQLGGVAVSAAFNHQPLTCTSETELDDVRRMMLERHARYLPVMDGKLLMGVISFYDVARTVVESQTFENRMLKAYIRDWPSERDQPAH